MRGETSAEPRRRLDPMALAPYPQVLDICHVAGLDPEVGCDRNGWYLAVYDLQELVARAHSTRKPPGCFVEVGRKVAGQLRHCKRLEP